MSKSRNCQITEIFEINFMINSKWTQCIAVSVFCVSCSQVQVLHTKSTNLKNEEAFWISAFSDLQGFF